MQLHRPLALQRQEWREFRGHIFQIPEANKRACPERSKPRAHAKGADNTFRCRPPDSPNIFLDHRDHVSRSRIDGRHLYDPKTLAESSTAIVENIVSTSLQ